jgi:predicted nuclease of predicted toxin-antitoxin system
MEWARANGYAVFTHDLDFGAVLAATQAEAPSVIQVRAQDILPSHLGEVVVRVLLRHESEITSAVLISIDEMGSGFGSFRSAIPGESIEGESFLPGAPRR